MYVVKIQVAVHLLVPRARCFHLTAQLELGLQLDGLGGALDWRVQQVLALPALLSNKFICKFNNGIDGLMLSLMKTQFFIFKIFSCNFQYYFEVTVIMKRVHNKITFIKVESSAPSC